MEVIDFRHRQLRQAHERWVKENGSLEGPVRLTTYQLPHQLHRLFWLRKHAYGSILDVGCSWGYTTAFLGAKAGLDLNSDNIRIAQLLNPEVDFRQGNCLSLPWSDREFDTVVLADILEHLPYEQVHRAVYEARRVAFTKVLITFPNATTSAKDAFNPKHQWALETEHLEYFSSYCLKCPYEIAQDGPKEFHCFILPGVANG